MSSNAVDQITRIDLDRLATIGWETIHLREFRAKQEIERKEAKRIDELVMEWKPFISDILDAMAIYLPIEGAETAGLKVVGPGWIIRIPDETRPYYDSTYKPVSLEIDGCVPISCWSSHGAVAFEATQPELIFHGLNGKWSVLNQLTQFGRRPAEVNNGDGDLTVAIANAVAGHAKMLELMAEAERRTNRGIVPDGFYDIRPRVNNWLNEARSIADAMKENGAVSPERFQAGVLAALIAIAEEMQFQTMYRE